MIIIELTQGFVAKIDDQDFLKVSAYKWGLQKRGRNLYAARRVKTSKGSTTLYLHRFLFPKAPRVDHRDGDGLNCQRYNLRAATPRQNLQAFQRKRVGCSSEFRGVSWHATGKKWQASIRVNGKSKGLGLFSDERAAASAYNSAAREYFGVFATQNDV